MSVSSFDVAVVGLGHAGCEAALASARRGLRTLAVTLQADRIALMSCNPAIGGTAKGHLVRELDALGGEMGRAADLSGTHFLTLNQSKGPAVQATRVLCDRAEYARVMGSVIRGTPGLEVWEGEVSELVVEGGRLVGLRLKDGREAVVGAAVLTTGTFLHAVMHVGQEKAVGGRLGDASAEGLSGSLRGLGLELGRFKTGTPPRLLAGSIDWSRCEEQPGDPAPRPVSRRTRMAERSAGEIFPRLGPLSCFITYTTPETHERIRENLHLSPLFRKEIVGRGPRYCPSLEDKVTRFAHRERHQVFLEPEGHDTDLVYPAGLSTSLPSDVQVKFLRCIPGLERVELARAGYAVEYDYVPPTQLFPTLETQKVRGLFLAGQLNGTSGYEEAAFQGFVAGVNAALSVQGESPFVLGRHEAHGGVLIDELVHKGVDEPFRMLTSRSEHRLELREGNAELRLLPAAERLGLQPESVRAEVRQRRDAIAAERERLRRRGLEEKLRRPEVTYASLASVDSERPVLPDDVTREVETDIKYAGYVAQHRRAWARENAAWDGHRFPESVRYSQIHGLSSEVAEKLERHRPATLGHARRIPGVTPAAVSLLLIFLEKARRTQSRE